MSNNSIFLVEKGKYDTIFAHRDLDGAFAAGLLLRIFPISLRFVRELSDASYAIIVEVPLAEGGEIENCLIIDHHNCSDLSSLSGNIVICNEEYLSVSSLITDIFDLEADDDILDIIDAIDSGEILGNERAMKIFLTYLINTDKISLEKLAFFVRDKKWGDFLKYFEKMYDPQRANELIQMAQEKKKDSIILAKRVAIIRYNPEDSIDSEITKLASIYLQEEGYIVISVAVKDDIVFFGKIATKSNTNLSKIYKKLRKMGMRAGGGKNVGGFKAQYRITFGEFKKLIETLL